MAGTVPGTSVSEGGYGGICGPFFVCGLSGDSFCSLTPEQMARYKAKYHHAEILLGARGNEPVTIKVEPQTKRGPEPPQNAAAPPRRSAALPGGRKKQKEKAGL